MNGLLGALRGSQGFGADVLADLRARRIRSVLDHCEFLIGQADRHGVDAGVFDLGASGARAHVPQRYPYTESLREGLHAADICVYDKSMTTTAAQTSTVTLGPTYAVEVFQHGPTGAYGDVMVTLTGPRGGQYFLRPFMHALRGKDDGLRQVISYQSGMPLRVRGNEVRVYCIGDVIEVAS